MSESQNYEEVTVASNGLTVIKTFEADAFPVPAIAFRINSDRTEAVTVRLVDDVPENVAVEDLGFHPEYGSEYWTIEDDEITFEREIEAEEQYTTVYGIRATGTDNVEQFLTEPEIAEVDPPLEGEDGVVGGSGSDVVRDVISGNADSVPGLEDEEAEEEDIGTLDLTDPNAEGAEADPDEVDLLGDEDETDEEAEDAAETEAEDADEEESKEPDEQEADTGEETEAESDETEDTEPDTGGSLDVESVASALATEIEEGEVDDDDLEVLRSELEIESSGGTGGAVEARIEKLQSDVTELDAYVDALEEFLEENGTGQDLIEGLQEDVSNLEDQLGGLEDDIEDNTQQVSALEDSVEGIQGDLQSLKGDVKDVDDDIDSIQGAIDDLEGELDDIDEVDDRVDDIEDDIVELKEWREQLSNVLGAADSD
jgi:predicted  nucleic acid-binding Zn-ribbon protein